MNDRSRFWRTAGWYWLLFVSIGLLDGVQSYVSGIISRQPVTLGFALGTGVLNWGSCGLLTPLYLWMVRRVPLRRPSLGLRIALYVCVLVLSVIPKYAVWIPLENAIFHTRWTFTATVPYEVFGVFIGQLSFVVLLYAMEYYRLAKERQLRATQLEVELSQAHLEALRAQIHPHFLFNTLNSISALMRQDVKAADDMLARLSEMLRLTMQSGSAQEAPLQSELQILERYLQIMNVRFGERLRTSVEVDETLLRERVPSFLLQPLVENTVRHGLNESSRPTTIRIRADVEGDMLSMQIVDDGRGLPAGDAYREGVGLSNVRKRLENLYGKTATLDLRAGSGGGTEVTVRIPRRMLAT